LVHLLVHHKLVIVMQPTHKLVLSNHKLVLSNHKLVLPNHKLVLANHKLVNNFQHLQGYGCLWATFSM
jgi:hypothetical protein